MFTGEDGEMSRVDAWEGGKHPGCDHCVSSPAELESKAGKSFLIRTSGASCPGRGSGYNDFYSSAPSQAVSQNKFMKHDCRTLKNYTVTGQADKFVHSTIPPFPCMVHSTTLIMLSVNCGSLGHFIRKLCVERASDSHRLLARL